MWENLWRNLLFSAWITAHIRYYNTEIWFSGKNRWEILKKLGKWKKSNFALAKSNPCDNLFFRSSIILSKSCFPVSGGVAGVSPAEGVAEDSLLAEARGRLSPSTLLINFQLTHPIVSHHVIENQSIPHDKFRFRHTKALIHSFLLWLFCLF